MSRKKLTTVHWVGSMENVYRVELGDQSGAVVDCLGMDCVDAEALGTYDDADDLPLWIQEKIAVLSIMEVDPPQTKVDGIGMRVSERVFWLVR